MSASSQSDYEKPSKVCDLVMQGGITSGVVYPLAVCRLARQFRFRSIGGASAGAIAAAAAAAAELGRSSPGGGFAELEKLPEFLSAKSAGSKRTTLFNLFQPQASTAGLFSTATAALGGGNGAPLRVLLAACRAFPVTALAGALPGLVLAVGAIAAAGGWFRWLALAIGILLVLTGIPLTLAVGCAARAVPALANNKFGLCSGMPGRAPRGAPALTPWLTGYLNKLAGRPDNGPPLTFGDLWKPRPGETSPNVRLEMMTTCLTFGRPFQLPLRDEEAARENRMFYFRPDEFETLFPKHVVDWMKAHPRAPNGEASKARRARLEPLGFLPLPESADIPVVVAVRMSLSFPFLLSAVPLHAIEFGVDELHLPKRCWFSDGGLSSNFPMHFFDSPLPRWPTFGIMLEDQEPGKRSAVWFPKRVGDGTRPKWSRFDERAPLGRLLGFTGSLIFSMKDWADNLQSRLPGFRDRIGHVLLEERDGGLNLDMDHDRIDRLCTFGAEIGEEFAQRFTAGKPDVELNWPMHRWMRLRGALAAIEGLLLKLERSCANPQPGDPPYDTFLADSIRDATHYKWGTGGDAAQFELAKRTLADLRALAQRMEEVGKNSAHALERGSPKPNPDLRTRPRL